MEIPKRYRETVIIGTSTSNQVLFQHDKPFVVLSILFPSDNGNYGKDLHQSGSHYKPTGSFKPERLQLMHYIRKYTSGHFNYVIDEKLAKMQQQIDIWSNCPTEYLNSSNVVAVILEVIK